MEFYRDFSKPLPEIDFDPATARIRRLCARLIGVALLTGLISTLLFFAH